MARRASARGKIERPRRAGLVGNIITVIIGAILIVWLVIWIQKNSASNAPHKAPAAPTARASSEEPHARPVSPVTLPRLPGQPAQVPVDPAANNPPPVKPPDMEPAPETKPPRFEPPTPPKPVAPAFIGDAQYKRYHKLDCKYVATIAADKKVEFASAAEAFDKGFIPCKVCNPEVPAEESAPTPVKPVRPAQTEPPPDVAPDEPVAVSTRLVGDMAKHRYHRSDCKYAKLIKGENLVAFKSPAEALDRDFYPCRTCNPDLPALMADLPKPEKPAKAGVPVKLTDKDKRAMYKSLNALKQMLKGISTPTRPYEVLSDRYHIPVSAVEAVEAEGSAAKWPRE